MPHTKEQLTYIEGTAQFPATIGRWRLVRTESGYAEYRHDVGMGFQNRLQLFDCMSHETKPIPVWGIQEAQCNGWGTAPPWFILRQLVFSSFEDMMAYLTNTPRPPRPPKRKARVPEPLTNEEIESLIKGEKERRA